MSLLAKAKINKISLDLSNYFYVIQGVGKSGKTTFFRNFILERYNGDASKGLLLSIGKETGYKALDNIQALEVKSWSEFATVIKELVQTKGQNGIEFVCLDVLDELIPLAEAQVIKMSVQQTGKPCKTFNAAFGGYGQPRLELRKLLTEAISVLNTHYGLIALSHTKVKTIKEQGETEEMSYQVLGSNLNEDYSNIFNHKADVIGTVVVEKSVDTDSKRLNGVETNLYFRGTNFVTAGSRFSNIVDKIPFTASNFIEAIENAIKGSATTTKINDEDFDKLAAQEKADREATLTKEVSEILSEEDTVEEVVNKKEMLDSIKANFMKSSSNIKLKAKEILSRAGATKLDESLSVEILKELTDLLS